MGGKVSFLGLLCLLFIGLKLGGVIAWSWLWVTAPIWLPVTAYTCIAAGLILFAGLVSMFG